VRATAGVIRSWSVLALVAWSGVSCSDRESASEAARPHRIVLVTIDTLRADHLPWHGYPRPTAPALEALSARSLVFTNAVSAASHTAPSHASMFTGVYPGQHRLLQNGMVFGDDVTTLAGRLADAGYETGAFSSVSFLGGLQRGFSNFDAPEPIDEASARDGVEFDRYRVASDTVDRAIHWLDERGERDAFVWVHLFDVHEWMRDEVVADDFRAIGAPSDDAHFAHLATTYAVNPEMNGDVRAAFVDRIDLYDAKILAVDREIERLRQALPSDHMLLVTADHGEGLGSHGYEGHGRELYAEQVEVPLIVHFSDERHVGVIDAVVRTIDLFPTVLDAAGLETPPLAKCADPALQARSLLRLTGPGADREPARLAFSQRRPGYPGGMNVSVQNRRHKLIHRPDGKDAFYDLRLDPRELKGHGGRHAAAFERFRKLSVRQLELHRAQAEGQKDAVVDPRFAAELEQLGYTK